MKTLTEQEFKAKYGAASVEKLNALDDTRFGVSENPPPEVMKRISQGVSTFNKAIGLSGATDVFGRLIARSSVGATITGTDVETNREFIEAPTGRQVAGAIAQTATIPAGAALTGGTSLAGQMAVGAGLGYIYDVGSDFAEGKTGLEPFKPGAETIAGAAIPVALRGLGMTGGAAIRGLGNLLDSTTSGVQSATRGIADTVADTISTTGIGQRAGEFAQRFPRAVRRVGEFVDEGAEIAQRKQTGTPAVVKALDEGLPIKTVDFVQKFDAPTKQAAKEMLELAEAGRGSALPQTIPGKIAGQQLEIVEKQRKEIGKKIGEFAESLPALKNIDITPQQNSVIDVFKQNGITLSPDGKFIASDNFKVSDEQVNVLNKIWEKVTSSNQLSAKNIHELDQWFSSTQRTSRVVDKVEDLYIKVPTADGAKDVPVYKFFRDVFGQRLDEVAEQIGRSDIRNLNRDYRSLSNLTDNVENTIVRQSRLEGVNVDISESASVALRRLFSNAQSKAEYQEVYDQLDALSRSLGYEGARADTLMDFYLTDMKPLYPDTVPQTSFEGGISGAISNFVSRVADLGSPNVKDKREALRLLLEEIEQTQ